MSVDELYTIIHKDAVIQLLVSKYSKYVGILLLEGLGFIAIAGFTAVVSSGIIIDYVIAKLAVSLALMPFIGIMHVLMKKSFGVKLVKRIEDEGVGTAIIIITTVIIAEELLVFVLGDIFDWSPYALAVILGLWSVMHLFNWIYGIGRNGEVIKMLNLPNFLFTIGTAVVKWRYMIMYGWALFPSSLFAHCLWDGVIKLSDAILSARESIRFRKHVFLKPYESLRVRIESMDSSIVALYMLDPEVSIWVNTKHAGEYMVPRIVG